MPNISTLVPDIQAVLLAPQGREAAEKVAMEVALNVGHRVSRALDRVERARKPGVLFPSELGHPCHRKTSYDFHYDPMTMLPAEEIGGLSRLKFLYGDIVESLIIPLAVAAGHEVTDVDKTVSWPVPGTHGEWQVRGRIDMVVDGIVVDVKSMAARSYDRWAMDGNAADSFGYSYQLAAYQVDAMGLPRPPVSQEAYILAVDKEGGKMSLVRGKQVDVAAAALDKARAANSPPHNWARMPTVPEGKSGNQKLGMFCSYCKYKQECWKDSNGGKGLRKFNYSYGPVWLTETVREPKVQETT